MIRSILFNGFVVGLLALLPPIPALAQPLPPSSVLVLDQSDLRGPFYYQLSAGLRGALAARATDRVTIYGDNLDLPRFGSAAYEESLKRHLREKYRDRSIGVIVAIGVGTFEHTLRWRDELWPNIPIVFAMLDEADFAKLGRPENVTGVLVRNSLAGAIESARAVVPNLDTIAMVGDNWDRQVLFRHWGDEIPAATAGLKLIDLVGQKMTDINRRIADLPERSAIVYSAVSSMARAHSIPLRPGWASSPKRQIARSWLERSRCWPSAGSADTFWSLWTSVRPPQNSRCVFFPASRPEISRR